MKLFIIIISAIFILSATEKKDTIIVINCDTTRIVRIIKDTTIIIHQDTLKNKIEKIKKEKK